MNSNNTQSNGMPDNDHELAVGAGAWPPRMPTESEQAGFDAAMQEAQQRFLAAALAEDGMPISAGWCEPSAASSSSSQDHKFTMIAVPVELEAAVRELIARKHTA